MNLFGAITVDANALATTEERLFPESRHRSARIRKKLIKRFGGEFRREPAAFQIGRRMVVHPVIYDQLKREIRSRQDAALERAMFYGGAPL